MLAWPPSSSSAESQLTKVGGNGLFICHGLQLVILAIVMAGEGSVVIGLLMDGAISMFLMVRVPMTSNGLVVGSARAASNGGIRKCIKLRKPPTAWDKISFLYLQGGAIDGLDANFTAPDKPWPGSGTGSQSRSSVSANQ